MNNSRRLTYFKIEDRNYTRDSPGQIDRREKNWN